MTIFLVFPFTRLVHVWSAPVWYLGRTGYQIVRTRRPLTGSGDKLAIAAERDPASVGRSARPTAAAGED